MSDASTDSKAILNTKELGKLASTLLEAVQKQKEELTSVVADMTQKGKKLFDAAITVGRSHSGSSFGYHSALYYGDFEAPSLGTMFDVEWGGLNGIPPGWKKREAEEVKGRIEKLASVTFAATEETLRAPLNATKELLKDILVRLAPLHQLPDGNRERTLLDGLENFDWQDAAHKKYAAQAIQHFPGATRDSGAFHQGIVFPAHSYYEAAAYEVEKSCEAIQGFWDSAERLLRQLQLGATQELVKMPESKDQPAPKPPASTDNSSDSSSSIWRNPIVVAAVVAAIAAIVAPIIAGFFSYIKDKPKEEFVLDGYVYSNKNTLINGARLTLAENGQPLQTQTSDERGAFFFSHLPSRDGNLEVSADGYGRKTFHFFSGVPMPIELISIADISSQIPQTATGHDVADCGNNAGNKANPSIARDEANHGWWYETGQIGNSPDYAKAMNCYLKAVNDGDVIANWNIGRLYEQGLGVQPDAETAKQWYKRAADQGYVRAEDYIKNIGHNQ